MKDLIFAALVLSAATLGPHATADDGVSPIDPQTALRTSQSVVGKTIGDYVLLDRDGKPVHLSRYRGKPLLVNFIYTGCSQVCPTSVRFLGKAARHAQATLGSDTFHIVSIGFNLPYDTPGAMREFARRHAVDIAGWEFLSPSAESLPQLIKDFGFAFTATPKGFDHLTQVSIVDAQGKIFRQVYGDQFELPTLIAPLKELILGTPAPSYDLAAIIEKVRLLCTVYDPRSGRYRLNYAVFVEILTGLSVLVSLLYVLLGAWWRNRRLRNV